ncbi:glutamine amidotransferase [Enterococcus florum]|uniref:Glutamine amidotransferase n=1 Tax=Enterococcus florum TaxID=2480627 RepID=A0A4P5PEQ0_9ENTE|nr:type 1 glutamine amidotransferase family protein [Enterococcus florum]GCF94122.1 glutamine amidotransferase [Enterococcus florum]
MKQTAIFFLVDQYADWEGAYLSALLNRSEQWTIKTAALQDEVTSIGGFTTKVDYRLADLPEQAELFVLIGGNTWDFENEQLKSRVKRDLENGVVVGAICGAVDYLAKNGLLTSYAHTGNTIFFWSDYSNYTNPADFIEQQAVRDRNLVTANGTAPLEFTEQLLLALDFDTAEEVEKTVAMYRLGYYQYCETYGNPYLS